MRMSNSNKLVNNHYQIVYATYTTQHSASYIESIVYNTYYTQHSASYIESIVYNTYYTA